MNGRIFNSQNYLSARKKGGFEGWYFKVILNGETFSFIVGVSKFKSDPHAFIQYIDKSRSGYFRFGLDEFSFDKKDMTVCVGKNTFSLTGICADLSGGEDGIFCDLKFENPLLFKKSAYAPSAMGPFSYLPFFCSHAVIALNINVTGQIKRGNEVIAGEGNCYIEKDYGRKFPQNYIWCHAHAPVPDGNAPGVVFALAYPLIFGIKGFICIFYINGRQYNLSLYDLAKLKTDIKDDGFFFSVKKGGCNIRAKVYFSEAPFFGLKAPDAGGMDAGVFETVSATLELEYKTKTMSGCVSLPAAFERRGEF